MSHDKNRRRPRLWPWIAALVFVLAGSVLAFQFFGSTGVFAGNQPPTTSIPSTQPKQIGEGVTVSGSAVPRDVKAQKAPNAIQPQFQNYKAPTRPWHVLSIGPSGKLKAPMNITLPLDHKAGKDDLVLVAVNHDHSATGWTYVGGTISPDQQHITITVTALSWFATFWTDLAGMVNELKTQFFDGMTSNVFNEAKPPSCDNESGARGDDYEVTSDNKDTIFWCFGIEGGKRTLKVVNHRKYPLVIKKSNMSTKDRGHADLDLSQFVNGGDDVMLNGGDQATFTVNNLNHGDIARLNTDLSKASLGLHALDVILSTAAQIIFKINPHAAGKASDFIQYFLDSKECVSALGDITNMGNFFKQCLTWDLLKEAFNWQVALAAPVMTAFSLVNLGQAITGAIADSGNGKSKYTVTVSRPKPNPFASFAKTWHVHGSMMHVYNNGNGDLSDELGPCTFSDTSDMCRMDAQVSYTASGPAIIGTLTSVKYVTWSSGPAPAETTRDYKVGFQFKLEHQKDPHLTTFTWLGQASFLNGGNANRCDEYAGARNDTAQYSLCGA